MRTSKVTALTARKSLRGHFFTLHVFFLLYKGQGGSQIRQAAVMSVSLWNGIFNFRCVPLPGENAIDCKVVPRGLGKHEACSQ